MYSRAPSPAASRRTPSEQWPDGGRRSPVFRIPGAYQEHDSNCTPPPITTIQDARRPSAYSEDVSPARAIRQQRGRSMYSPPAIVKYVRFERAGVERYRIWEGDLVKELYGSPLSGVRETGREFLRSEVRFLVPCLPSKVLAVGLNYCSRYVTLLPGDVIFT